MQGRGIWRKWGILGLVLPYLSMVGGSAVMTPILGIFNPIGSQFYTATWPNWSPLCAEKINLFLSHLVPEIQGSKVGLTVHQNVLFNRFFAFCINFLIDFRSNWPIFFIDFKSVWPLIFTKPEIRLGSIFVRMLNPATKNLVKYSPPCPMGDITSSTYLMGR